MSDSFVTLWTMARQAPLSMAFPRQEYWSGLPFPSPENLSHPGTEPMSPALQADSLLLHHRTSLRMRCITNSVEMNLRRLWDDIAGQRNLAGYSSWGHKELDLS